MRSYRMLRCLVFVMMVLMFALPVAAQTTTATIRGRVLSEGGEALAGADIVATNVDTGFTNLATSRSDGSFVLGGLTPGTYTILVASPAHREQTEERTVLVGQTLNLVFRLTPATVLTEAITVIGDTFVETKTPQIATNVTRTQVESLPQNDRNFLNFAILAPGIQLGTDEFKKEVRAGAQTSSATNVFIDGVSFKNDVIVGGVVGQDSSRGNPFPQNAVQEFRVVTQNYSAEFQKASSAIITAITRSGTNTLSGDLFYLYQDKEMVDENPLTGADPEFERTQWGVNVGGPIVRDRMHFFASFEANEQDREETVVLGGSFQAFPELRQQLRQFEGTFVSPFREDLAFGKLSYKPTQHQLLDWSAHFRDETDIRNFGGRRSREAAENIKNDVWSTTLRHQYTANTWLNEFSASLQEFTWNPQPLNPTLVGRDYDGLIRVGGADTEQDIGQDRLSFRDDVTFTSLRGAGTHTLKAGAIVEFLDYTVKKLFTSNPVFVFRQDTFITRPDGTRELFPREARWGIGDPDLSASNTEYGLYVQDDWSVNPQLILNLGLRWDYETDMLNPDYVTPAAIRERLSGEFPARYFTDGNDREPHTDLFQPRVGFSYDVFENGRTVVFGGAGRYYDRVLFNSILDERFRLQYTVGTFRFSETGEPRDNAATVAWDPRFFSIAGLQEILATGATGRPQVFLIANDTEVPYSNQWNIGVRQSFGDILASLAYANIRSYHGFTFLWGAGSCCQEYLPFSQVLISSDDVRTWYDAIYLTFDRPFNSRSNWGFNTAITWADAEQIGGDLFSLDLPRIEDWPRYGTPGTQDLKIVANGILGLPWDIRLSSLVQYSSGDKFRIHDFSRGFCVGCYVPRTGESPSWTTIDLRGEKDFAVGPARLGVILEAFNITNEERYAGFFDFNPPEGNPNIGKPNRIVGGSQRRFQVGLRIGF